MVVEWIIRKNSLKLSNLWSVESVVGSATARPDSTKGDQEGGS